MKQVERKVAGSVTQTWDARRPLDSTANLRSSDQQGLRVRQSCVIPRYRRLQDKHRECHRTNVCCESWLSCSLSDLEFVSLCARPIASNDWKAQMKIRQLVKKVNAEICRVGSGS